MLITLRVQRIKHEEEVKRTQILYSMIVDNLELFHKQMLDNTNIKYADYLP